jgi:tetratricopeptide (TPR) repeat protein
VRHDDAALLLEYRAAAEAAANAVKIAKNDDARHWDLAIANLGIANTLVEKTPPDLRGAEEPYRMAEQEFLQATLLRDAAEYWNQVFMVRYDLSLVKSKEGDAKAQVDALTNGLKALDQAIKKAPTDAVYVLNRYSAESDIAGVLETGGRVEDALLHRRRAMTASIQASLLAPSNLDYQLDVARAAVAVEKDDADDQDAAELCTVALRASRRGIEMAPDFAVAWNLAGLVQYEVAKRELSSGDREAAAEYYRESIDDVRKAIALDGREQTYQTNLAYVQEAQKAMGDK